MNMTFSILVVGAPILVGARGSCPICPMVNPALVSALIRDNLHWLPAVQRIKFMILQLVANCIHQRAPLYLQELFVLVSAVPGRRHLRSADQFCLVVFYGQSLSAIIDAEAGFRCRGTVGLE